MDDVAQELAEVLGLEPHLTFEVFRAAMEAEIVKGLGIPHVVVVAMAKDRTRRTGE